MHSVEEGPVNFSVATLEEAGLRLINVRGEVDASTTPALQAEFERAITASGPVVVDLCGTSFMDSAGQFALLVFRQRLVEQERRLAIACWPDGAVAMLFRISGTDRMFELHPSRATAVAAVTNASPGPA